MLKHAARFAAVAAVVPIAVALSAVPSQAQVVTGGVTVTGTATCNIDTGHETWTLHWTITNDVGLDIPDRIPAAIVGQPVNIDSAVETGGATEDLLSAVTPNPIPASSSATATDGPVANAVVDVRLGVDWSFPDTEIGDKVSGIIHLDGSCVLPVSVTTAAPTTTATPAAAAAVTADPAFTG